MFPPSFKVVLLEGHFKIDFSISMQILDDWIIIIFQSTWKYIYTEESDISK